MLKSIFVTGFVFFLFACMQNKYTATNKDYKKQAKKFAKVLQQYPLNDSAGLAYTPQIGRAHV